MPRDPLTPWALLRPYRLRLACGVACLLLLAASAALYAYLAGPVLQLLLSGGARGESYVRALLPGAPPRLGVTLVAALLVALAAVKGLAHLGQVLLLDGTAERVGCDLRVRLYGHLLRLPLAVHRRETVGDLPSVEEMGEAIAAAAADASLPSGSMVVVGGSLESMLAGVE